MPVPGGPMQIRLCPPCAGYEPSSVSGLCQMRCAAPVVASPTQIEKGLGVCFRIGFGAPPRPAMRTKAMRLPSGDQRGMARAVGGRRQIGERLGFGVVDRDEAVVVAVAGRIEGKLGAVRRPLQIVGIAAVEEQPLRLVVLLWAVERGGPHLAVLDIGELAFGRDRRRVALGHLHRRAARKATPPRS